MWSGKIRRISEEMHLYRVGGCLGLSSLEILLRMSRLLKMVCVC